MENKLLISAKGWTSLRHEVKNLATSFHRVSTQNRIAIRRSKIRGKGYSGLGYAIEPELISIYSDDPMVWEIALTRSLAEMTDSIHFYGSKEFLKFVVKILLDAGVDPSDEAERAREIPFNPLSLNYEYEDILKRDEQVIRHLVNNNKIFQAYYDLIRDPGRILEVQTLHRSRSRGISR